MTQGFINQAFLDDPDWMSKLDAATKARVIKLVDEMADHAGTVQADRIKLFAEQCRQMKTDEENYFAAQYAKFQVILTTGTPGTAASVPSAAAPTPATAPAPSAAVEQPEWPSMGRKRRRYVDRAT